MIEYVKKEKINKGWSEDIKYRITDQNGQDYLFRVADLKFKERKHTEFEMMKKVSALMIPMCEPIEFGICDEGVYSIQSWINGTDAEDAIKELPADLQYSYGIDAGRTLKKINTINAPEGLPEWEERFNQKIDRKIKNYSECPLKYDNGDCFIRYIESHRHLLKNRPLVFQHGDYHIGNMMIDNNQRLVVIDFNRFDFGDPYEEFNRIVWSAQASPAFASGIVDGYFDGSVPKLFWRLLALYISSNTLSSLSWAMSFGEAEIKTMKKQGKEILDWYDDMNTVIPLWYKNY